MRSAETALKGKDTAPLAALYISFELGDKHWTLTISDGLRRPSHYAVAAGDKAAVLDRICKAKARCGLPAQAPVHSCYEAGRDGWWLHRWLREQGVHNIVVDSASIEVNRRARRTKTDRLDGDKLLAMLLRHQAGERHLWSVLHEPTPQEEDARRPQRELERLTHERTAHTNRIGSLLVLHNLRRPARASASAWAAWWQQHREQLPPLLRAEIERENERLALVNRQIKTLETAWRQAGASGQPLIAQLATLRAIGAGSAWTLATEMFGWRRFDNRRQVAACVGPAPSPYASGDSTHEQGISKAGNRRVRTLLVELAWRWLRLQPESTLTQWFERRFAAGSKRMRRVGIVALARRLAIALWRFAQRGEIPAGALLKPTRA